MMHNTDEIYKQLHIHLLEINGQIDAIKADAEKRIAALPYPEVTTVYMLKHPDGTFVLSDLLAAKATALAAMANLKASNTKPAAGRGRNW